MSKRIMNELFCLTEDIGCHIYYQDTDSGHFYKDEIGRIAEAFQKKYGRELIGQNLGQFHVDYADPEDEAVECIFLGKKVYLDKLVKKGGKEDWHVRMKGVPSGVIKDKARDEEKSLIQLYLEMVGQKQTFDLLSHQRISLMRQSNGFFINRQEFIR